jgi:hypothetical protein
MSRLTVRVVVLLGLAGLGPSIPMNPAAAAVTREEVERAIHDGVRFLQRQQRADGSWAEVGPEAGPGTTALVTLALITAGESPHSPAVARAVDLLSRFGPDDMGSVYAVSLQTMVLAAARPDDQVKIAANVRWLEDAQIKPGDRVPWPGSWTYSALKNQRGDGSNTQYALLGLNAAGEAGVPVKDEVWARSRGYWETCQRPDGGWNYHPADRPQSYASMTCAGISSLIITGLKRFQGQESLAGEAIRDCGKGGENPKLRAGIDWLSAHFRVGENFPRGQQWRYYYLYGLERAGRLTGQRFFGNHDWYREGAEKLVHDQDKLSGFWRGGSVVEGRDPPLVSTSFALLFLAKGRAPVLVNKLRHLPKDDWDHDADDARNLVNLVSRDWKALLTWQVVDPAVASVEDMLMAPIAFFNGHEVPEFDEAGRRLLRDYVEQGGFILADACCGREAFDRGFRALMERVFPEPEYKLHELGPDHAVWRAKHVLSPEAHPLWGIEHGCRTVVIYSPQDLSCYWNQMENSPSNPAVVLAGQLGQNIVDYATGREMPPPKEVLREVKDFKAESPRRGALHIAKLQHGGDWNVAPLAIPNLTTSLRDALKYHVVINHKSLTPRDPNLVNYPLIYVHGRAALSFERRDLEALRRHLDPGGGTIFADAACGSAAFDAAFRRFVAELLPKHRLEPIPRDDELYTQRVGYDLSKVQYSQAAGGGRDYPQLEGVKVDGRWAVIYSKYDIGCALERHQGPDCKGYTTESALKIAANIVIYATLP